MSLHSYVEHLVFLQFHLHWVLHYNLLLVSMDSYSSYVDHLSSNIWKVPNITESVYKICNFILYK